MAFLEYTKDITVTASGGTFTGLYSDRFTNYRIISAGPTIMNANVAFDATDTLYNGQAMVWRYEAELDTLTNNTLVSFHGVYLPQQQTAKKYTIKAIYDLPTTTWDVQFFPDFEQTDIINGSQIIDDSITLNHLTDLDSAKLIIGDSSNRPQERAVTGDITISNTGVTAISSNVILNSDINTNAAIAVTKLANGTNAQVLLTNGTTPTWTTLSGDATVSSTGVITVNPSVINTLWEPGAGTESAQLINTSDPNTSSGDHSVTIGSNCLATGNNSLAVGNGCSTANESFAAGLNCQANGDVSFSIGDSNRSAGTASLSLGRYAYAKRNGQVSIASDNPTSSITDDVYAQLTQLSSTITTTTADPTILDLMASSTSSIVINNHSVVNFSIKVTAVQKGGSSGTIGDYATWNFDGSIENLSNTVNFIGDVIYQDATGAPQTVSTQRTSKGGGSSWTLGVTANNTAKSLNLTVTGAGNKTIVWCATYILNEIKYA